VFEFVLADIAELVRNESGALAKLGVVLLHPGLHAVLLYRMARWLHLHHLRPLAVLTSYVGSVLTGAQISARAAIGKGLVVYHPHGIVIGATAVIGEHCVLVHGNVIGQLAGGGDRPVIGSHFFAGTGAKILGKILIGDGVRVGPNTVVTESLPDGLTVVGNPSRIIHRRGALISEQPSSESRDSSTDSRALVRRLVEVITSNVPVAVPADTISENTVLLGEGIGLDSIEMLHVISAIEEEFGLTLDERDLKVRNLRTLGSLAAFIKRRLAR
jgi:serine O-acetyltransferase